MEIIETTALISINATLVALLISFLLFLFVFNRLMIRPVREKMARRETQIVRLKRDTQHLHQKVEALMAEMQAADRAVRHEASQIRNQHRKEGQHEAQQTLQKARAEIETLRQQAEERLAQKMIAVRDQLESQAQDLAEMILAKVFDRG